MYVLDDHDVVHNITEEDITCIEVSRPNIIYRTLHGIFRAPRTLADFVKIYEPRSFIRINKNKLANIRLADKIENGSIHYADFSHPISRRIFPKIKSKIARDKPN